MSARKQPKLPIIIISLLVLVTGGYTALWFTQANVAKNEITAFISRMNSSAEIITYESITTEGFPKALVVRIKQPVAKLPMQALLRPLGAQMPPAPDGTDQAAMRKALLEVPEWVETVKLNGDLAFTVNTKSDSYHIEPVGNYEVTSSINGKQLSYAIEFEEGARGCDLDFTRSKKGSALKLWNWDYLSGDAAAAIDALQKVECHVPPYKTYVNKADDASYTSAPLTFIFENNGSGDTVDIQLKLENMEYSATEDFDRLMTHYFQGMYPDTPLPAHYRMAPLGKQKFNFEGSMAFNKVTPETSPIKIALKDLSYQSDISETHNTLSLESNKQADGTKVVWNLKSDTSFKEAAYKNYLSQAADYASAVYKAISQTQELPMDEMSFVTQYQSIIPKLHELGNVSIAFAGNSELKDSMGMPVELENFAVNVAPYGIEAKGKGAIPSALAPVPTGEYMLTCRSCLSLVDDGAAWFQRFQPLLKQVDGASYWSSLNVTPEAVNGIKNFLQKLAPKDVDTLHYTIVLDPSGNVSINQKPMQEIEALYDAEIGKLLDAGMRSSSSDAGVPAVQAAPVSPVTSTSTLPPAL